MKRFLLFISVLFCVFLPQILEAQKSVSGVINDYTAIEQIKNKFSTNLDTLKVTDHSSFGVGDTVMVYVHKGAEVFTFSGPNYGLISPVKDAGLYQISIIGEILALTSEIVLNSVLDSSRFDAFDSNHEAQLIRVRGYDNPVIDGEINFTPYDPANGCGGVVALIANGRLTFDNAGIDVSAGGFHGADPAADNFTGNCSGGAAEYLLHGFPASADDTAGLKGGSPAGKSYDGLRGRGRIINAGGGGYGMFSGGAGGGNGGAGGSGGKELHSCNPGFIEVIGGKVGTSYYTNTGDPVFHYNNRIFFGGGGGTSTSNAINIASKGGNGGGIVVILADTVFSNNGYIRANGQDVTIPATAGGGGGGGGGVVVMDFETIVGDLEIAAKGGKGGNTNHPADTTGPGGGGGGGLIWYAGDTLSFIANLSGGLHGIYAPSGNLPYGALSGSGGRIIDNLVLPLRAFLYNLVPRDQYICEGETPEMLIASRPKGGDGNYDIKWYQSNDLANWTLADGVNDQRNYSPPALTDTTFYKRVIFSDGILDSSTVTTIFVHDAINNSLNTNQEICYGVKPLLINGNTPTGGNGSNWLISWESTGNGSEWSDIGFAGEDFQPDTLFDTVWYRRIVESGACRHVSDTAEILVHPLIQNFNIEQNQLLCENEQADTLMSAAVISGGKKSYTFSWNQSADGNSWNPIAGATDDWYYPGILTNTVYLRRNTTSGPCQAQSNEVMITVHPHISGNLIEDNEAICFHTRPAQFSTVGAVSGGDGSYLYNWEYNSGAGFLDIADSIENYWSDPLDDTTIFRRIAISGACIDTSNTIQVNVLDSIENEIVTPDQEHCQGFMPDSIIALVSNGGDGSNYDYLWESGNDTVSFSDATGQNSGISYFPTNTQTRYFRRKVVSGFCHSYSRVVSVLILDSIINNEIINQLPVYTCYNTSPALLEGSALLAGGNGEYEYEWQKSTDNLTWGAGEGDNTTVDYSGPPLIDSIYYRRVVLSGELKACKDTSEVVKILIHPLPVGQLTTISDTICSNDSIQLSFSISGNEPFQVVLSNDNDSTIKTDLVNGIDSAWVQSDVPGVFTISRLTDVNGCDATDKAGEADVFVYMVPATFAGNDTVVCGPEMVLQASADIGNGIWKAIETGAGFSSENQENATVTIDSFGLYHFIWKETEGICFNKDTVEVTFYEQPQSLDIQDTTIYFHFETTLSAKEPESGNGYWTADDLVSIDDADEATTIFTFPYLEYDDYVVQWHLKNGVCPVASDSMTVSVRYLKIPTGFSPNGDGKNQAFVIKGIEFTEENTLVIFNRWGNVLFETKDYQNDWEGTSKNGNPLPDDTYYYIFNYDGGKTHKGFIVLKR